MEGGEQGVGGRVVLAGFPSAGGGQDPAGGGVHGSAQPGGGPAGDGLRGDRAGGIEKQCKRITLFFINTDFFLN